jgi:ABC-2 type transport system permease protein
MMMKETPPEPPSPTATIERNPSRGPSRASRAALALISALGPVLGEPRAQWLVGRVYALVYLARYYLAAQHARARLGVFWVALAPLLLMAVYLPVFLYVFKQRLPDRPSELDYALHCLVGLMAWAAVSEAIGQGGGSLVTHSSIVRHAPTPPAMLPIVKVLGAFAGLAVGLATFLLVLALSGNWPGVRLVMLPVSFGLLLVATIGATLALSALAAYVRDLLQALPTLLAVEFFAAPIVYPLSKEWDPWIQFGLGLNPLTPFLSLLRASLLPWHPFAWDDLGLACAWTAGAVVVGGAVFRKLEPGLGDVV